MSVYLLMIYDNLCPKSNRVYDVFEDYSDASEAAKILTEKFKDLSGVEISIECWNVKQKGVK